MLLLFTVIFSFVFPELAAAKCTCGNNWVSFRNSCYIYIDDPVSWASAQTVCGLLKSRLVEIESAAENRFLVHQMTVRGVQHFVWIGLNDLVQEGRYVWTSTNKPAAYVNWSKGEPNNAGGKQQDCGNMYTTGKWDDDYCAREGRLKPFFCEKETRCVHAQLPSAEGR